MAVAIAVVRQVEATGVPADQLLREHLREAGLKGQPAGDVARSVFAWFRWRGFLERFAPDEHGLERAMDLDARYARHPERFEPPALLQRAIPAWLSGEMDVSGNWVRTLQAAPPLWLRARPGGAGVLQERLTGAKAANLAALPEALRYTGSADLYRRDEYTSGLFEIQDIASQAVGRVCAPRSGETWWDACAGEGGKTLHLADLMENRGLIWATDRSARRLANLKRRAARAGVFNYRAALWPDIAKVPTRTRFDGVLVDAPCSGVGTWARNPHARWTVTVDDVQELAQVQLQLLCTASSSLKPGGRLVYSVCTLTRRETVEVADAFEARAAGFEPLSFADPWRNNRPATPRQFWWPQDTGGNGMFVAAWKRISV